MDSLLSTFDTDRETLERQLGVALKGCDDGELFMEYTQSESLVFDNGKLKAGNFNTEQGLGLRAVSGEVVAYAHSGEMSLASLKRASDAVSAVSGGHSGAYADGPKRTNRHLYSEINPLAEPGFEAKVKLLQEIDAYVRARDPKVRQVSASLGANWQVVEIVRGRMTFRTAGLPEEEFLPLQLLFCRLLRIEFPIEIEFRSGGEIEHRLKLPHRRNGGATIQRVHPFLGCRDLVAVEIGGPLLEFREVFHAPQGPL